MWDRPFLFVIINLLIYVPCLVFFGFQAAPLITSIISLFVLSYNYSKVGVFNSLCLVILYLLIFDSDAYTFTYIKFRLWYFPLIILLTTQWILLLFNRKFILHKNFIFYIIPIIVLFFCSLYYLIVDDLVFKLHIVKYWLFSIGLIAALIIFFKRCKSDLVPLLNFIFSLVVFTAIYGIIQFGFNLLGNFSLINTPGNVRPEAFFSETTWYAEFLILGFVIVPILSKLTSNSNYYFWLLLFLLGLIISNTRNAFLGLAVLVFFEGFFLTSTRGYNFRFKFRFIIIAVVLTIGIAIITVIYFDIVHSTFDAIIARFKINEDGSGRGRLDAFRVSFEMTRSTPFFGNGFYWTTDIAVGEGNSAVGAKSFNLLLMIYHIFGPFGFMFFIFLVTIYGIELVQTMIMLPNIFSRMAFYTFIIFFLMSMFAPIHQFPIGMLFVSLSVFLLYVGQNEKRLFRTA